MKKYFLKIIILFAFFIQLNSFGQSVVINEIITDPQTDWSTNSFNGTDGGGTISNVDEAIELYIKTDGIDLNGWTIELVDGTDVIGGLTNTGAFDVSNYISSNGGAFNNTKNGDFLVLGNVNSSGAINNNITITLKNAIGTVIDTVTLGGGTNEAPSGNASSITDESVQRTSNGVDTNTDNADFSKGVASLGSTNLPVVLTTKSFDNKLNANIYPNPVKNGKLFVETNSLGVNNINIYNVLGRKVLTKKATSTDQIDVSSLRSGIYVLTITSNNKSLTRKIVIQ